jgi:DNA-binding CsgD family transcriptional regulator
MLAERQEELGLLDELLDESVAGQGRVVLISGSVASGKTALLHTFSERVVERDGLLLTATGARAERSLRMGVVWQLFRSMPLPRELHAEVARLIDVEPQVAVDSEPVTMREADAGAVHGVCALLLQLAAERPVVIAVDDLQYVDSASLQVLLYLRRRLRSAALLLVMTEWERPSQARPVLRAEITRQPDRRIVLGPLSEAGVTELMARELGQDVADRLAPGSYELSGGNPFLAGALIEDQARRTGPREIAVSAVLAVGPVFREAVLDLLNRWSPEFLRVAGAMAILGARTTPELVAELIGEQQHSVDQAFEVLTAAGLVADGRLRRAEFVVTVLESIPPGDRARLHEQTAELLSRTGADATEVARHIVDANAVPGPWAVRLLRHAADHALVEDAALAVRYLELAMRACTDERERVALRSALVRVAWRVNPSAAAPHLTPLQDALGEVGWRDAVPVIRHQLWNGDLRSAAGQLRAVSLASGPAEVRTAAELRLTIEWIYGQLRDRVPDEVQSQLTATDTGTSGTSGNPWRRTAMLNAMWLRGSTGEVVSAAEHILQGCLGDVAPEVGASALLALDYAGHQKRALFWCDSLIQEATRQRATTWQALLSCVRADIAWRRGDLMAAHTHAGAAMGMLNTQSWGVLVGFPLGVLVQANTAMGTLDTAAELLAQAVPEAMFETTFGLRYLHASGHYHLAAGRPLAALDDFERCAATIRSWGLDLTAIVPWRSDLAEARLRLGMRRQARELVVEQLERPRTGVGPRTKGLSLRVLAACTDLPDRLRILGDAVQVLERCADRLELARALMDLSQAHRELGDLGNARTVLRRAEQVAKSCHAKVVPEQQGPVPVTTGQEPLIVTSHASLQGMSTLSEAERKVAALAAHGHTNREIGRKLYITVSTVEQHLTRVYRKLNVRKRADLPAELSRHHDTVDRVTA